MTIRAADDFDEFIRQEEQARQAADAQVRPWQKHIKPGDYFVRDTPYGFDIYGEVLEPDAPYTGHMEHYQFCRAYLVACPDGELGDIHVSLVAWVLRQEEFEEAKARPWR